MTEVTLIIVAIIAAVPPTLAVFLTRRDTKRELYVIHDLVNSSYTDSVEAREKAEAAQEVQMEEIRQLRDFIDKRLPGGQSSTDAVPRPPEGNQSL